MARVSGLPPRNPKTYLPPPSSVWLRISSSIDYSPLIYLPSDHGPFVSSRHHHQIVVLSQEYRPATIRCYRKSEMRPYRSPRRLRIFWHCDLACSSPSKCTPRRHPSSARCWSSRCRPRALSDADRPVIRDWLSPTWFPRSDIRLPDTSNGEFRQRRRSPSVSGECTEALDGKFQVYVYFPRSF